MVAKVHGEKKSCEKSADKSLHKLNQDGSQYHVRLILVIEVQNDVLHDI